MESTVNKPSQTFFLILAKVKTLIHTHRLVSQAINPDHQRESASLQRQACERLEVFAAGWTAHLFGLTTPHLTHLTISTTKLNHALPSLCWLLLSTPKKKVDIFACPFSQVPHRTNRDPERTHITNRKFGFFWLFLCFFFPRFWFEVSMCAEKQQPAKAFLPELEECLGRASKRKGAYSTVGEKKGVSIGSKKERTSVPSLYY